MIAKDDYLARYKSKPKPFTYGGGDVLLRVLSHGERTSLVTWYSENKDKVDAGVTLYKKVAALSLCDSEGKAVFTEAEVNELDADFVEAVGIEAAKRSGINQGDDGEKKADSTSPVSSSPTP